MFKLNGFNQADYPSIYSCSSPDGLKKYVFNGRKQKTHLILFIKLLMIAVLVLSNEYIF